MAVLRSASSVAGYITMHRRGRNGMFRSQRDRCTRVLDNDNCFRQNRRKYPGIGPDAPTRSIDCRCQRPEQAHHAQERRSGSVLLAHEAEDASGAGTQESSVAVVQDALLPVPPAAIHLVVEDWRSPRRLFHDAVQRQRRSNPRLHGALVLQDAGTSRRLHHLDRQGQPCRLLATGGSWICIIAWEPTPLGRTGIG